jgi:CheY-like chemotaxis protein
MQLMHLQFEIKISTECIINITQKKNLKVLVVDDSYIARKMVEKIMAYVPEIKEVEHAEDGQYIYSSKYDLIFLDIDMPRMNGFQLLEEFNNNPPEHRPKVIMISADCTLRTIKTAFALGADSYVSRPFKYKSLISKFQLVTKDLDMVHVIG